ncbi:MAG: hypothetical protein ACREH3_14835 [Geminicoccales bacterium]
MYVVIGGGLLAGGLLIVVLLTSLFHRARGPRWLNAELTAMLLCLPPAGMLGLGAAYVLTGLAGDHRPIDLVALIGWLAIGFGLLWLLRRRRAALAGAAEGGPEVLSFEPPTPPKPKSPGRPHRAA